MSTFLDIFAGAGGLSEGMIRAGFEPILHAERDTHATDTLKTRAAFHDLVSKEKGHIYRLYTKGHLTKHELHRSCASACQKVVTVEISRKTVPIIIKRAKYELAKRGQERLDLMVGGPPCQPFSIIGRHANGNKKRDRRVWLFRHYIAILKALKPKIFVFENVPGLLTIREGKVFKEMSRLLKDVGYVIEAKITDASDFGVLQKRRRLFILGVDSAFKITPSFPEAIKECWQVSHVLDDLPKVLPGETANCLGYRKPISSYLEWSGIRKSCDELTWHEARPHNETDREIYRRVISTWTYSSRRLLCSELPKKLQGSRATSNFRDRYKVVAKNLAHSHTVIAHIAKDGHYYIHPDIRQARSLTVREAARLQSFPDNYHFEGGRRAAYQQIGNAVPPLLAFHFGVSLKALLHSHASRICTSPKLSPTSTPSPTARG